MTSPTKSPIRLQAIAASPGIQVGRAALHYHSDAPLAPRKISPGGVGGELRRLGKALDLAEEEILKLQARLLEKLDEAHAAIFESHLLFVRDPALREQVERRIRAKHESAHFAVMAVIRELADQFGAMGDAYISSRAADVLDVGRRICKHLGNTSGASGTISFPHDVILFAHDLSPSDTALLDHQRVKAFATDIGGPTSHTAILAKALEIPAVVGLGNVMRSVSAGDRVLVDGYEGVVVINPTDEEVKRARGRRRRHLLRERDFRRLKALPAETIDGYRVELSANIEFPNEVDHVLGSGANGIGLFRTEFLYLRERRLPTEDEQFSVYREVLRSVAPGPVIFRTLDVGGDKFLQEISSRTELNPFLGLRAIRFCLQRPDIFRTQLRALLRASVTGKAKIMFPMVSSVDEVIAAKKLLQEAQAELREEGRPFDEDIEVGIMIEIPSAALTAERLAEEVDFFSIGTNDLIQYTLAADRSNEKVAHIYEPYHPAVLKLIRMVIDAAHRAGIWVGVCGEMASNPATALLLLGLGIDELSMGAVSIPEIKYLLRHVRLSEARKVAGRTVNMRSAAEIRLLVETVHAELRRRRIRRDEPAGELALRGNGA
jgi:phosphoenolpyruvate-protein phosphotransferase (PTS system enzyme I)